MRKFWLYFTNAFGFFWFILLFISLIIGKHINIGFIGLAIVLAIAFIYGLIRANLKTRVERQVESLKEENEQLKIEMESLKKEKSKKKTKTVD